MQLAPSGTDRAEAEALAALLESDRLARATYAATGVDDPGLVFADANGNEVHPHALSQAFDGSCGARHADHQPSRVVPAFRDVGCGQVVQVGAAGVGAGGLFGAVELGTEFRGDPRELLGVDGAVGELVGGKV
jgi:hypothetical protein